MRLYLVFLMIGLWGGDIACDTTEFPVYIEGSEKLIYTKIKELKTEIILEGFDNEVREKLDKLMIMRNEIGKDEPFLWKKILILVKKFLNIIERIDRLEQVSMSKTLTTDEDMGSEVLTIDVHTYFNSIIDHFNQEPTRGKRDEITFNSFRSIGKNNDYIDMKSVVGCSSIVEYNKRKNICIKRFINMIKTPVINFIGSDILFPLIVLIEKPIPVLSNIEVRQIMTMLDLGEMSKNEFLSILRERLVNPGTVYNEARQEIENRNRISSTTERQEVGIRDRIITESTTKNQALSSTTERQEVGIRDRIMTESTTERKEVGIRDRIITESTTERQEVGIRDRITTESTTEKQELENRNSKIDTTTEKYEINYQVQSDMPIEISLEGEKQARVENDIKITKEVLENERDIEVLKGQLAELIGNFNAIQIQTSDIDQARVESDIKIVNEVVENERDIGLLKGQLDELKGNLNVIQTRTSSIEQNEYTNMAVFVFLKEIINYLENMNYLSEINTWERKIFRLSLNKFIIKEKILENDLLLKTIIPVPTCNNLICSYRLYNGYILNENDYINEKYCEFKNSNYCDEEKKVELCKNMDCEVIKKLNHTNEIFIFENVMFLYPKKTINLFNLTFVRNNNYLIRSKDTIIFNFEGENYTLLGSNLVRDIEVVTYPISSTVGVTDVWTLIDDYKEIIVIVGTGIIGLIGASLLIYLIKKKCCNENNSNSRVININNTRVRFSRPIEQ